MAPLAQVQCGTLSKLRCQMMQQVALPQQNKAFLSCQRGLLPRNGQQGLAFRRSSAQRKGGHITMELGSEILKIVQEKETMEETLSSCNQLASRADFHPDRYDLILYNGHVAHLHMKVQRELVAAKSDMIRVLEELTRAKDEIIDKMEENARIVKAYEDALEILLGLAHENGNLVLRVFVEVGLRNMHTDHLGPLADPDCCTYQAELVANRVIQPDPRSPGSYLYSKNAQLFDKAKGLAHFAKCKSFNYMVYEFISADNEVIIKKWQPQVLEQEIENAAAGIWRKLHVPHHTLDSSTRVVRLLKDGRSSEPELLLFYSMIRHKGVDVIIEEGQSPSPPLELYVERAKYLQSLTETN